MSRALSDEVITDIKALITHISGFEEGTQAFNYMYKHVTTKIKKSDTMYFLNKRNVDQNIAGMAEKFCFHGFFPQADALKLTYTKYIPEKALKTEVNNKLNVVKFLLCMSERPTDKFLEKPEEFATPNIFEEEEEINWSEYLNEGIEKWSPNYDESSDESDVEESATSANSDRLKDSSVSSSFFIPLVIKSPTRDVFSDFRTSREELLATIQPTWYAQENFCMKPQSHWREANIGILWDSYLRNQIKDLIPIKPASVITEYLAIREIIWQLFRPHTSVTYEIIGNDIIPKSDVTISSVRAETFERFMYEFLPYIEMMEFFRDFAKCVNVKADPDLTKISRTYRSYSQGLNNIINSIYNKLCEIEDEVRKQETTYTLLKLAYEFNHLFEPIKTLKNIHQELIIEFNENTPLLCATTLLTRLHESLQFCFNKLDQDIRLSLFLESLRQYLSLINDWLMKDDLTDYTGEFVIKNKNQTMFDSNAIYEEANRLSLNEDWKENFDMPADNFSCSSKNLDTRPPECTETEMNFELKPEVENFFKNNSFMRIICVKVLKIGRNINFLRLLGKHDIIGEYGETIYDEFVRKTLEEMCKFYDVNSEEFICTKIENNETEIDFNPKNYIYPVICTENCKRPTEMDRLENLVDTNDGFLMAAFSEFFIQKPETTETTKNSEEFTLYDKISKITKNVFPKMYFFEKIFLEILEERFTISGLKVKNILVEEHLIEKQFQFLRHIYLFFDDIIFPFYRSFFEKSASSNKNWGNKMWLTTHLQDIIVDIYPEFSQRCSVQVQDNWKYCTDSLDACDFVSLNYEIVWPLNIIIKSDQIAMYRDVFRFILKLKWALYTVSHLVFTDLDPKKRSTKKLQYLKFSIINILNSVQHFIFGFIFNKCVMEFELNFEKANDLNSLIESHSDFIKSLHKMVMDIKDCMKEEDRFNIILKCVKLLKHMWKNQEHGTLERLRECNEQFKVFYKDISPIILPFYLFDY